jgi:uncharacterized membrane protein YoaK (UPF0700 family)
MTMPVQTLRRLAFDDTDGPLLLLLAGLTIVTGMVDALSFLRLGEVFVANMTGNIVLLGFDVAGVPGFSAPPHLAALAAFVFGAALGGRLGKGFGAHRARLVALVALVKCAVAAIAIVLTLLLVEPDGLALRYALIVLLAASMGLQNAAIRRLRMPDMTTTVLTGTITTLAADLSVAAASREQVARRVFSAVLLFIGAALGAVLLTLAGIRAVLLFDLAMLAAVALGALRFWASDAPWTR